MKRHNGKAIAAAMAIAAAAAAKQKLEPKSLGASVVLYVDVAKRMPESESAPAPPARTSPEFTMMREDFPALPGTQERFTVPPTPEHWMAILSDDDEDDDIKLRRSPIKQNATVLKVEPEMLPDLLVQLESSSLSPSSDEELAKCKLPAVAHVAANADIQVGPNIYFEKPFLNAGAYERAWNERRKTNTMVRPPPGFGNTKIYGCLNSNRMGLPLGGVTFDKTPPRLNFGAPASTCMEGPYGLKGLARNLTMAKQNPQNMLQIFGHELSGLNVNASWKQHAGPLENGRGAPHEINYDVPIHYLCSDRTKLTQPKIEEMEVEGLFLFFYTYPGDMMQLMAAAELADRGWRFHIPERVWLRPQMDNPNYTKFGSRRLGEYNYFNMVHWKIMARHFDLHPDQLERTITKSELRKKYGYHEQMGSSFL